MKKKFILFFMAAVWMIVLVASCSKDESDGIYRYLGDYAYDSSLIAMVYEDFEGQGYGVLYRRVNDFSRLIKAAQTPVLLYFYTSMHADYAGTTATIEQIAEDYHGQVIVLAIDVFQEGHIAEHYDINTVPEFILLNESYVVSRFDSAQREQWPNEDVDKWMQNYLSKIVVKE